MVTYLGETVDIMETYLGKTVLYIKYYMVVQQQNSRHICV